MRIALYYNRHPGVVGEYFERALRGLGHTIEQLQLSDAGSRPGAYDVHLRIDHGDYAHDLPTHLRPSAFYAVDAHLARSWRGIRRQARQYDLVFCAQRRAAESVARGCWVPLGCDPDIHAGRPTVKRYDLAFVGTDGGVPRKLYLQELRERYPNSFIGQAPYTQMAETYSQAKIGFHYIECTSPLKDHVSMRVYEILASGTLLFANALAPGTFEGIGLQDRRHLVVYRSPKELFKLIDYYLAHDDERERIAAAGRACVLGAHTYRHRVAQIVKVMQEKLGVG